MFLIPAVGMHFILPVRRIIQPPFTYFGLIPILLGVSLNVWSANLLKKKNKTIEFDDLPKGLVTNGPFRISRNPVYPGGVILNGKSQVNLQEDLTRS